MLKCIIFISSLALVSAASKYYDGENRPYEFGFNIEGNQHRHEKKDENGIIMGEFGFITADNVYHVTVYATDADGHFKIISMKNIRLMSEPMAKNIASAIATMRSNFESSSPQPRQLDLDTLDITTTPQPFVIHSTAAPARELEVMLDLTTPKASDIKSCSNCKIPEPPAPAVQPQNQPLSPSFSPNLGRSSVPPQMPPLMSVMGRFQSTNPQVPSQAPSLGPSNLNLMGNFQSMSPQVPNQAPSLGPSNLNLMDENSFDAGQGQDQNQDQDIPPSSDLSPPLATSQPAQQPAKEDYSSAVNALPEGRSLADDFPATLTPEVKVDGASPEDMPIESVMARFKGVEVPRKQPEEQQYYSPQPRTSPDSGDSDADMEQMLQGLLYLFNYTAGYHGHNEQGDREGNKEGEYYFVDRDGYRRSTEYRANQFGYQPKFKLEKVPEEETPREETEKEAGLKGYEFKWFYL
ncbi:uncharacterized protein LOC132260413 [Phlebotomus argentipes]|uniref:uncharacterized protein LOC132260413 n=1 Tax=Phlebotomus argentipes TaxID=94469 RepID=UPI0028930DD4|nr:uncharacterized protein LOC132260413 [Phlebotomus argentipes]